MDKYMEINYKSNYYQYAGKTVDWVPSDDSATFLHNVRHNLQLLKDNNWFPFKQIKYFFNDYGFRCDNFIQESRSIMFLGCSFSFGVGVFYEDTYGYNVSTKLNLKNINLGIPGSSSNTAFRLGSYWIPILKPKIVVYLESSEDRLEIVANENFFDLVPKHSNSDLKLFYENYWLIDRTNSYLNSLKNKLALENICNQHGIKFIHRPFWTMVEYKDLGRDLKHCGSKSHLELSNKLLNIINSTS